VSTTGVGDAAGAAAAGEQEAETFGGAIAGLGAAPVEPTASGAAGEAADADTEAEEGAEIDASAPWRPAGVARAVDEVAPEALALALAVAVVDALALADSDGNAGPRVAAAVGNSVALRALHGSASSSVMPPAKAWMLVIKMGLAVMVTTLDGSGAADPCSTTSCRPTVPSNRGITNEIAA